MRIFQFMILMPALGCFAVRAGAAETKPDELQVVRQYVGVWDAAIEVWPAGPDSPSIKFEGVETNQAHGEYWISSDFVSEFSGETMTVHSIVGYDLDKNSLVGMVVDHGPYSAQMTGEYDKATGSVTWSTEAKDVNGDRIVQRTLVTQTTPDKRVLVLSVPDEQPNEFTTFMRIIFVKRE